MVLINNEVLIVVKPSALSSNQPLFAWYLALQYPNHGVFIN